MTERDVRLEEADLVVLENRWQDTCKGLNLHDNPPLGQCSVFEMVATNYIRRAGYHNLDHINFMFRLLDQYKGKIRNHGTVDFAVFFHDLIYFAQSSMNEEDSARLARIHLYAMGARGALVEDVSDLIL